MTNHEVPAPNALTRTEAAKLSKAVPLAELLDMIEDDGNPVIYEYRKHRKIGFDLSVYRNRYPFVAFGYCDRKGYTRAGSADIADLFTKTPTVFRLDRFGGYYHTEES